MRRASYTPKQSISYITRDEMTGMMRLQRTLQQVSPNFRLPICSELHRLVTYLRDKLVCVHVQKRDMNLVNKRIQYIRNTGIQHLLKSINTRGTYSVIWQCIPNVYSSHREKTSA